MLLVHPVVELVKFLPVLVGIFVLGSNGNQGWWQLFGVAIPIAPRHHAVPHHDVPDHAARRSSCSAD